MPNNYFNKRIEDHKMSSDFKQHVLVIYDISKSKRRNKFIKILNTFGARVQKSAFEFLLDKRQYATLLDMIDTFYEESENDQLRVYKFRGEMGLIIWGDAEMVTNEDVIVI